MSHAFAARRAATAAGSALFALSLAACSAGGSSSQGNGGKYEFVFATGEAEGSPNVTPAKAFMEEVTKKTDGRVTWKTHYSGSLIPSTEIAKAVKDGRIDSGILTSPYDPAGFPLYNVGYVPYPETNTVGATRALKRMFEENDAMKAEADRNGVHFVMHTGSTNASTLVTAKPIDDMTDLKSMKVRVIGGLATGLSTGGANPMAIPVEETFDALERGVIDGIAGSSIASIVTYKMPDMAPETAFLPTGHYSSSIGMLMNKKTWDELPPDIRAVMDDAVKKHYEDLPKDVTAMESQACDSLIEMGANINWFPRKESEREAWKKKIGNSMFDEWRKASVKSGVSEKDAQTVEDDFKRLSAEEAKKATDYTAGEEACIDKSSKG